MQGGSVGRARNRFGLAGRFGQPAGNPFPVFGFLVPPAGLPCAENPRVVGSPADAGPALAHARALAGRDDTLSVVASNPGSPNPGHHSEMVYSGHIVYTSFRGHDYQLELVRAVALSDRMSYF